MPITSSVYETDAHQQIDGSRWVREAHTDTAGKVWVFHYKAADGTDYAAILTARAASLDDLLQELELEEFINGAPFVLVHQTVTQLAARFRKAYRTASKERLAKLAYWLIERINDGTFTDNQVRNAFNLTVGQYSTLKTKAIALHDSEALIQQAQGE